MDTGEFGRAYIGRDVLITGGMGFIGSNLAHRLVSLGAVVTIADCYLSDHGANERNIAGIEDKVRKAHADIRDTETIGSLVEGQDYIFNLAAQCLHIDSMREPKLDLDINCYGQLNILEACRARNPEVKIVFSSTRQVYGRPEYLPLDESHPLNPVDINGIHKIAGEQYHSLYRENYGLRTVSLRLTNTYGPRQIMKHNRANFTGWLVRQALDDEQIEIFGDGSQLRDFTYIDDVVEALLLCGAMPGADGEIYNLGGIRPYSLLEFVDLVLELCGRGSRVCVPFPEDRGAIEVGGVYSSYAKIENSLGWSPKIRLEDGLRETIAYYTENRSGYW